MRIVLIILLFGHVILCQAVSAQPNAPASIVGLQFEYQPEGVALSMPIQELYGAEGYVLNGFSGSVLERTSYSYADGVISLDDFDEEIRLNFDTATSGTYQLLDVLGVDSYELDETGTFTILDSSSLEDRSESDWERTEAFDSDLPLSPSYWNIRRRSEDAVTIQDDGLNFVFDVADPDDELEVEVTYGRTLPLDKSWQVVLDDVHAVSSLDAFNVCLEIEVEEVGFECTLGFEYFNDSHSVYTSIRHEGAAQVALVTSERDAHLASGTVNLRVRHDANSRDMLFEYQPVGVGEWAELARFDLQTGVFVPNFYIVSAGVSFGVVAVAEAVAEGATTGATAAGVDLETAEAAITEGATEADTEAGVSESEAQAAAAAGEAEEAGEAVADEAAAFEAQAEEAGVDYGIGIDMESIIDDDVVVSPSPEFLVVDPQLGLESSAVLSTAQRMSVRIEAEVVAVTQIGDLKMAGIEIARIEIASVLESYGEVDLLEGSSGYFAGSEETPLLYEGTQFSRSTYPAYNALSVEALAEGGYQLLITDGSIYKVANFNENGISSNSFAEVSDLIVEEVFFRQDLDDDGYVGFPPPNSLDGQTYRFSVSGDRTLSVPLEIEFESMTSNEGFSSSLLVSDRPYDWASGVVEYDGGDELRLTFTAATSGTFEHWKVDERGLYNGALYLEDEGTFSQQSSSLVLKTDWQRTETMDSGLTTDYWNVWSREGNYLVSVEGYLSFIFTDVARNVNVAEGGYTAKEDFAEIEIEYGRTLPMNENWQVVLDDVYATNLLNDFDVEFELQVEEMGF